MYCSKCSHPERLYETEYYLGYPSTSTKSLSFFNLLYAFVIFHVRYFTNHLKLLVWPPFNTLKIVVKYPFQLVYSIGYFIIFHQYEKSCYISDEDTQLFRSFAPNIMEKYNNDPSIQQFSYILTHNKLPLMLEKYDDNTLMMRDISNTYVMFFTHSDGENLLLSRIKTSRGYTEVDEIIWRDKDFRKLLQLTYVEIFTTFAMYVHNPAHTCTYLTYREIFNTFPKDSKIFKLFHIFRPNMFEQEWVNNKLFSFVSKKVGESLPNYLDNYQERYEKLPNGLYRKQDLSLIEETCVRMIMRYADWEIKGTYLNDEKYLMKLEQVLSSHMSLKFLDPLEGLERYLKLLSRIFTLFLIDVSADIHHIDGCSQSTCIDIISGKAILDNVDSFYLDDKKDIKFLNSFTMNLWSFLASLGTNRSPKFLDTLPKHFHDKRIYKMWKNVDDTLKERNESRIFVYRGCYPSLLPTNNTV